MAKIPVYEQTQTLPGKSGAVETPFAMDDVGKALGEVGKRMYWLSSDLKQAALKDKQEREMAEFAYASSMYKRILGESLLELEKTGDPDVASKAWPEMKQKAYEQARSAITMTDAYKQFDIFAEEHGVNRDIDVAKLVWQLNRDQTMALEHAAMNEYIASGDRESAFALIDASAVIPEVQKVVLKESANKEISTNTAFADIAQAVDNDLEWEYNPERYPGLDEKEQDSLEAHFRSKKNQKRIDEDLVEREREKKYSEDFFKIYMHGGTKSTAELSRLAESGEVSYEFASRWDSTFKSIQETSLRRVESLKKQELLEATKDMSLSDAEIYIFADGQGISFDDAKENYNDVALKFIKSGNERVITDAINNKEISPDMGKLIRADNKTKATINYKMTYVAEANRLAENLINLSIDPKGAVSEFNALADPDIIDRDGLGKLANGVLKSAIERSGISLTGKYGAGKSNAGKLIEEIGVEGFIDPTELLDYDGFGTDYTPVPNGQEDTTERPPMR